MAQENYQSDLLDPFIEPGLYILPSKGVLLDVPVVSGAALQPLMKRVNGADTSMLGSQVHGIISNDANPMSPVTPRPPEVNYSMSNLPRAGFKWEEWNVKFKGGQNVRRLRTRDIENRNAERCPITTLSGKVMNGLGESIYKDAGQVNDTETSKARVPEFIEESASKALRESLWSPRAIEPRMVQPTTPVMERDWDMLDRDEIQDSEYLIVDADAWQ